MKVLKEGNYSNEFPMKVKCKKVLDKNNLGYGNAKDYCGSELEIEVDDIKKHDWFKYPDLKGVDYGVICPVCGSFVVVDENKIPKSVSDNAEEFRFGCM